MMVRNQLRWGIGTLAIGALLALPVASSAADKQVTFSKDVAPIFQAKCQQCHEPGSIAPMSLRTYQESRPWAKSIKDRVAQRQMPPWHIDRSVGIQKFKNDISLTDEQVATIVAWVDQGALEGNAADLKLKPVNDKLYWQAEHDGYGPPDLVVSSPEYTMPAVSQDQWWRPTVDIPQLTEPRWVRMVEIRPTNLTGRKILHHSIAHVVMNDADPDSINKGIASPRRGPDVDVDASIDARPTLMEWAIGKGYDRYPDGTGKLIKPGDKISWDQHVHAVGEDVTAGSSLGIWLYPKGQEPKHRIYLQGFTGLKNGTVGLDIPPNSVAHTEGFTVLKENTVITNFQPHFHLRGKAMQVEAILPDGSNQVVSYVDKFNFNWMTNYIYADEVAPAFPKGTIIHVTAFYDNTTANKNNPDPNQWVGYGDRTVDEMAHAWMNIYYLSDAEYAEYQAAHKKPATSTQNQQQ
ncbi:MAG TPA: cytochrome c [Vicinamibacterales bacterium]